MSDIVLSASVRQNLLSLQSTAELLATTQNRLSTGKKVNTALDNPTNYFTAAGLDNRASDISNLLDSIGNGVQVLQAANTGITSLQKLVDTAKSIANQVLQQPSGYSTKASAAFLVWGAWVAGVGHNHGRGHQRPARSVVRVFHVRDKIGVPRRDDHRRWHGCFCLQFHHQGGDGQYRWMTSTQALSAAGRQCDGFAHRGP